MGHVGENDRGTAENIGLELHSVIKRDIILNLNPVSDDDRRGGKDILPDDAIRPDVSPCHDVREMPDFRSRPDPLRLLDNRRRMDKDLHLALKGNGCALAFEGELGFL